MRITWAVPVLLLAFCCGCANRQASTGARVDPALEMMIPPDTTLLAGIKMEPIRATPVYQKFVEGKPQPELDEFARASGLDPLRDVWEMLVAGNGKDFVAMLRGKFTPSGGLEPKLDIPGARRMPYKGYTLIGTDDMAVVFMNASTAAAGKPAALKSLIDKRDKPTGFREPLKGMVRNLPASSQLWLVSTGNFLPPSFHMEGNWQNVETLYRMVRRITLAFDFRKGLDTTIHATCATDQDARQMHDALKGFIGLGRLSTRDDQRDLLRVYDAIHVTQQQQDVHVAVEMPMDLLEKAAGMITSFQPESRPPGSSNPRPR